MKKRQKQGRSRAFWILIVFLAVVFMMGGSSRKDIPMLVLLRPISVFVAVYALATTSAEQWRTFRVPIIMLATMVGLTLLHLIPLPPGLWQAIPGRAIVIDIQTMAGQPDVWLPLAMVPDNALNALYALFTPIAVLFLSIQLTDSDNFWLLVALIGLALLSAVVGVMQGAGINFRLYAIMSDTPPGLFANRNHQAALLAMLFPMLAMMASVGERFGFDRGLVRVLAGALAIAVVPLVLVTGSRMGLVVCVVALLSIAALKLELLSPGLLRKGAASKVAIGAAVAGVIGAIALAAAMTSRNAAVSRLTVLDEDLRFSVWEQVWTHLPGYLPLGSGIGSYVEVYQIHEPASALISSYSNHVHNDWLEVVMTAGIPGLILLAAAVALFVVAAWRSLGELGTQSKFKRLGLAMILVLAIASSVDYPLRTPIMAAIFAVATVWASRPIYGLRENKGRAANV